MYVKPNRSSCECWRGIYAFYARKGLMAGVRLSATMRLLLSVHLPQRWSMFQIGWWFEAQIQHFLFAVAASTTFFRDRSLSTHALTHRHTSTPAYGTLRSWTCVHHHLHSPLVLRECVYILWICVCVCVCIREHFSLNLCVFANPVWLHRGAEVSDCLVSVGGKLWRFALTVNLEEFLMELESCQASKCCTFFFPRWKERWLDPPYTTRFWKSEEDIS